MKAHYKGEERVTLVDIVVGGTFPFTLATFTQCAYGLPIRKWLLFEE